MDAKTLTALQGSIAKWEAIVNEGGVDLLYTNCPLCKEFNEECEEEPEWAKDGCFGCPVSEKVQLSGCSGTPYEKWSDYQNLSKRGFESRKVFDDKSMAFAQEELAFLISLLPTNEPSEGNGSQP